eukprot:m.24352 g.24352  ORF g.24352 m.24352 type:complete len:326 (-) comp8672_c0_seq2:29-1006(-)
MPRIKQWAFIGLFPCHFLGHTTTHQMCIIFFDYQPDGGAHGYRLVLAANRDEVLSREAAPAAFWGEGGRVLSGVDLTPGKITHGTWLGLTRDGRFGALTNYRGIERDGPEIRGRGVLIRDFLLGTDAPGPYSSHVHAEGDLYSGFSLLLGHFHGAGKDTASEGATKSEGEVQPASAASTGLSPRTQPRDELWFTTNAGECRALDPGRYGLSNHTIDFPWPKLVDGKERLGQLLTQNLTQDALVDALLALLASRTKYEDSTLPPHGRGIEWAARLSTIFVDFPEVNYGTRTHTIVLIANDGAVRFVEVTRGSGGDWTRQDFQWTLE